MLEITDHLQKKLMGFGQFSSLVQYHTRDYKEDDDEEDEEYQGSDGDDEDDDSNSIDDYIFWKIKNKIMMICMEESKALLLRSMKNGGKRDSGRSIATSSDLAKRL